MHLFLQISDVCMQCNKNSLRGMGHKSSLRIPRTSGRQRRRKRERERKKETERERERRENQNYKFARNDRAGWLETMLASLSICT